MVLTDADDRNINNGGTSGKRFGLPGACPWSGSERFPESGRIFGDGNQRSGGSILSDNLYYQRYGASVSG